MSKLTPVEAAAHHQRELEKFWRASCEARGINLDVFIAVLEAAAERDNRWFAERWYRDSVQTGKAACLDITGGQWP